MSAVPLPCPDCGKPGVFAGVGPFPPGLEVSYGVFWKCPGCGKRNLDVCNLGPLVPVPGCCLNCGATDGARHDECPGCNLTAEQVRALLHLDDTPDTHPLIAAQAAFQQKLYRRALGLLNRLLQTDLANETAWQAKEDFLEMLGFHGARQQMLAGAIHAGGPPALLVSLGALLRQMGEHRDAVAAFEQYLEGTPDPERLPVVLSEQALALTALGDFAGAETCHRRAVAARPTWAPLHLNFADLFIKQQRWPEAEQTLTTGLTHATSAADRIDLLDAKAHVLAKQQRGAEALAAADEARDLGSNSARTHYLRGRALALLGRLPEAQVAMRQVLIVDPDNGDAHQALRQIQQALDA